MRGSLHHPAVAVGTEVDSLSLKEGVSDKEETLTELLEAGSVPVCTETKTHADILYCTVHCTLLVVLRI